MIISRFSKNVLTNSVMSVVNGLFQLLLIMAVGRLTDEVFFASFLIAAALVAISEHGSEFGSSVWGMQRFASASVPARVLISCFQVKAFFSLILLCLLLILPIPTLSLVQVFLCFLVAVTQPSADPILWFLRGTERLDKDALVLVLWKAASVGIMALILWSGGTLDMMLTGWFCINVLRQLLVYACLRTLLGTGKPRPPHELDKHHFAMAELASDTVSDDKLLSVVRRSIPTGTSSLVMALNQRILLFVMGFIASTSDLSQFGAAHTLVSQAGFLAMALVLSYLPSLARTQDAAFASGDDTAMREILRRKFSRIALLIGAFCLFGIAASATLATIVYGQQFPLAGPLMSVLWPGLFLWSISISLRFVLALRRSAWIDLSGSAAGLASSVTLLWIGAMLNADSQSLVWIAAIAWVAGLFIECSIKTAALLRSSVLSKPTALLLTCWFVVVCGCALFMAKHSTSFF